jgi:hypothetical protein
LWVGGGADVVEAVEVADLEDSCLATCSLLPSAVRKEPSGRCLSLGGSGGGAVTLKSPLDFGTSAGRLAWGGNGMTKGGEVAVGEVLGVKVSLFLVAIAFVASTAFARLSSAVALTALGMG